MNVGQLRTWLAAQADLPDDAPILVEGMDHSYCVASITRDDVERHKGSYYEYYDDANMIDKTSKKVEGLVVR